MDWKSMDSTRCDSSLAGTATSVVTLVIKIRIIGKLRLLMLKLCCEAQCVI